MGFIAMLVLSQQSGGNATTLAGAQSTLTQSTLTSDAPITYALSGTVTISATWDCMGSSSLKILRDAINHPERTHPCPGGPGGGYSDLTEGAQVVVTDASGTTVAFGSLADGTISGAGFTFTFSVPNVPALDIYGIKLTHRGTLQYSFDELQQQDWDISLTVG